MGRRRGRRGKRGKMPKRNELIARDQRSDFANAIGTIAACIALFLGILMLILAATRGNRCKMYAINFSSWGNDDIDGNLVKWFKYTGTLLILSGIFANLTIGLGPAILKTCCPGVGGAIANICVGVCGKMVLFTMYLITLLCNLLGQFWLSVAGRARTPGNSDIEGQVNYCDPMIWYTAHVVVNTFWVISALGVLMICAGISRFCRSEESRYQPIILGTPSKKEIEEMKRMEDIRKYEKDLHSIV